MVEVHPSNMKANWQNMKCIATMSLRVCVAGNCGNQSFPEMPRVSTTALSFEEN